MTPLTVVTDAPFIICCRILSLFRRVALEILSNGSETLRSDSTVFFGFHSFITWLSPPVLFIGLDIVEQLLTISIFALNELRCFITPSSE